MQLTDFLFLFAFLPAALICAALTGNRPHARNALLLAMSVLFCAASGLPGLLAAAIEILAAFFFGRALERAGEPKRRKCILALGIVIAAQHYEKIGNHGSLPLLVKFYHIVFIQSL